MGIFDFLKKKDPVNDEKTPPALNESIDPASNSSQSLVPFFGNLLIPENIRQLLWFGDGKFQNYNSENDQKVLFENELFRITFSFQKEPSLIYINMPVDFQSNGDNVEKLGYYPTYIQLNPQQRFVYLKWLCDITKPVDIGYVFIFYYGLERHLVSGKYSEAINTISTLRQYHKHPSFIAYSA
ncbi:MAG: TerB N-terminal domain-containing protein, partial [Methanoregula sp.]